MGDVIEESVAGAQGEGRCRAHRIAGAADHHDVIAGVQDAVRARARDHLGEARCRIGNEIAVEVGPQQRHIVDIEVAQLDAEHRQGLGLDLGPGRNATVVGVVEQLAGRNRPAVRAELRTRAGTPGARNEMYTFGSGQRTELWCFGSLAVVSSRLSSTPMRRRIIAEYAVGAGAGELGGARQQHEVGVAAFHVQRVVRLQRN